MRYVGPIESKDGEYAGIELIDGWASQGLHSGEYRGVQYFETSQPGSGLFIPYLKLLNAQQQYPQQQQLGSPHKIVSTKRSAITPSKIPLFASPRAKRMDFPSLSGTSPTRAFSAESAEISESMVINTNSDSNGVANGVDTAAAVVLAVAKVQADAQKQITELRDELEMYKSEVKEREQILEEQSQLLKDLESTVVEFQSLKEQEEAVKATATDENANYEDDEKDQVINALRAQLEDKERKITTLKSQLDQRRAEFRATLEDMQREMEETNLVFEDEIKALQQRLHDAEKLAQHVAELERVVTELEAHNTSSNHGTEKSSDGSSNDAELKAKVVELESKLNERDDTIDDLKTELSTTKQELAGYNVSRRISSIGAGLVNGSPNGDGCNNSRINSLVVEEEANERLRQQLKSEREKRMQFEVEIANLESVVETRIFREEELEQEIAQLRAENSHLQAQAANSGASRSPILGEPVSRSQKLSQRLSTYNSDRDQELLDTDIDEDAVLMMGTAASDMSDIDASAAIIPGTAIAIGTPPPATNIDLAAGRSKWCGLCERDGHESIECPYENDF